MQLVARAARGGQERTARIFPLNWLNRKSDIEIGVSPHSAIRLPSSALSSSRSRANPRSRFPALGRLLPAAVFRARRGWRRIQGNLPRPRGATGVQVGTSVRDESAPGRSVPLACFKDCVHRSQCPASTTPALE
ncbi:uncharacterized protein PS065_004913 isoform 2-T2 [Dugong dugon]